MNRNLRLRSETFDGLREIGGFGQPLHALYSQVRAVLAYELGPEAAWLLAEPVVDRSKGRIDWYADTDPDQKAIALMALSEAQRQSVLATVDTWLGRGRELAERYAAADDPRRSQLGAVLRAVLASPDPEKIFLVEDKPVITGWGFTADRPWPAMEGLSDHVSAETAPAKSAPDVAIPAIAIPDTSAIASSAAESPLLTASSATASERNDEPSSNPNPSAESSPSAPPSAFAAESPPRSVNDPMNTASTATENPPPVTPTVPEESAVASVGDALHKMDSHPSSPLSTSLFRYVVVGSRYFWSVVIIALLLALLAGFWGWSNKPLAIGDPAATAVTKVAEDGEVLRQARQHEAELRVRLEQLLVDLASRRGRCLQSDSTDAASASVPVTSATRDEGSTSTLDHGAKSPSIPGQAPRDNNPAQVKRDRENGASVANANMTNPPITGPSGAGPEVVSPSGTGVIGAATSRSLVNGKAATDAANTTSAATSVSAPMTGQTRPTDQQLEAVLANSVNGKSATDGKSATNAANATSAATSASALMTGQTRPADQQLEAALANEDADAMATLQRQLIPTPPVKIEPTPEERREFNNRLSQAKATTGEITVSLLWNSRSDLDLVVRCAADRQLDYRNSSECGGTLDVDANIVRDKLSDRPVENAYWPAGKAEPGNYEVVVRYIPRKDEEAAQETPFQVRLSQGRQESVFKGVIRPNAIVPVTTFTVKR